MYPDGSHNAEALFVTSDSINVITKVSSGPSGIYTFPTPLAPGQEVTLIKLGELTPPSRINLITAASWRPNGILVRTYTSLFFYPTLLPAGPTDVAATLASEPCSLAVAFEVQGETVEWSNTFTGYLTISEGGSQADNRVSCR